MKKVISLLSVLSLITLISCNNGSGEWKTIFDGKELKNWKASQPSENFTVTDGIFVLTNQSGEVVYENRSGYKNFEFSAEMKTTGSAFSTIRFHTGNDPSGTHKKGYEVVINNTRRQMDEKERAMTSGSLLGVRNVWFPMVPEDQWFWLTIRVSENHIKTFINDIKVVDYVQPENPWRGEGNSSRVVGSGTFSLQTLTGETSFREIRVMRLPDEEPFASPVDQQWDTKVTQLMEQNFPLIDFHVHLKGGLTIEDAIINSQKLGINYGIAPNCGLKFPVTDDVSLAAYMDTVRGMPIFRGMQAEGREWITLFSPEAVAKFDYVFTDALTFTDYKGRRNRLWIPEEVWVDNNQQFMEQLVGKIEAIFSQEPAEIYVNPTLLPASLMPEYDQLWTADMIDRVVKVLKDNNIALEINARYKIPSATIIKAAKAAGVKFSFGTNNTAAELGQLEYSLQMKEECGLTPEDMFMPRIQEQKPVLVKGLPAKITG